MHPTSETHTVVGIPDDNYVQPLVTGLDQRHDVTLRTWPPCELPAALRSGACGCALVNPTVLLSIPGLRVLPGVGLVARENAPTGCLVPARPLEEIRRVAVVPEAAHLTEYVRLLFAARSLSPLTFVPIAESEPGELDATLVSEPATNGDPGVDLGALWVETTGLPMVLGVWACGSDAPGRQLRHILGEAGRQGEEAAYDGTGEARFPDSCGRFYYRLLSQECDSLRALESLAMQHAIGETTAETIVFW